MTASAENVRYSLKGCSLFQCLTDCVSDNAASECAYFHSHENSEGALSTCVDIIVFYEGKSNINRPLSVATSEQARLCNDLARRCGGEWGPSSPCRQTHPSPQLVEFKMSAREVPITIAQRVVIKFVTNENVGSNEIWR